MGEAAGGPVYKLKEAVNTDESKSLWVFGYGSLCWKPGFVFEKAVTGFVQGYSRRFWQGNITHRGTEDMPGRVATLVQDNEGLVHGVAFQIVGDEALNYLAERECKLGGYSTEFATFYPRSSGVPFTTILYIATSKNSLWLGDAPLLDIANQITDSSGASGHNVEYLLRLANFVHKHFPQENDDHLFNLEQLVKMKIRDKNLCLKSLMGEDSNIITFVKEEPGEVLGNDDDDDEQEDRVDFQFTTRIPEKTLRCLNI